MAINGKFGALVANVAETHKVVLISPMDDLPIKDKDGREAYVEVLSADSEEGRKFDREQRLTFQRRAMRGRNQSIIEDDALEQNIAKLARLTRSWYLVDPETQEKIDVACSSEAAKELYSEPGLQWLYRQVFIGSNETANFIRRSSKTSSSSPSTNSASAEDVTTVAPNAITS